MTLVPQECRGVSKLRHLKFYWDKTGASPGFVIEVIGRCNGACVQGAMYKFGDKVRLPLDTVSTIAVGQSCYIFFAPAIRDPSAKPSLTPNQETEYSETELSVASPVPQKDGPSEVSGAPPPSSKRFPKIWSRAIMEVFTSLGATAMSQSDLVDNFWTFHRDACIAFFGVDDTLPREELWSNIKKFVNKPPFSYDPNFFLVRFDASAVKPRASGIPKRQKPNPPPEVATEPVGSPVD